MPGGVVGAFRFSILARIGPACDGSSLMARFRSGIRDDDDDDAEDDFDNGDGLGELSLSRRHHSAIVSSNVLLVAW